MKLPWKRQSPEEKAADFWRWFLDTVPNAADLETPARQDQLSRQLKEIHPDLCWGFSPEGRSGAVLEISADGIQELIPTVRLLVDAAPQVPGWQIHAFRQPCSLEGVEIRLGPDLSISADSIFWRELDRDGSTIDLQVFVPHPDPEVRAQIGFIFLDHCLGELAVMTRLGALDFEDARIGAEGVLPLEALPAHLGIAAVQPGA